MKIDDKFMNIHTIFDSTDLIKHDGPNVENDARRISETILEKYTPFNQNRIIQLIVKNIQDVREEKLKDIRRSESEMIEAMKGLNKSIRE